MRNLIRQKISELLIGIVAVSVILEDYLPKLRWHLSSLILAATITLIIKVFRDEARYFKTVFLICPIRGVTADELEDIKIYVAKLEGTGKKVYWPYRDTNQNDPVGLRICTDNCNAIKASYEIHIWWKPNSEGSKFDLGMAFALEKKIVIANPEDVKAMSGKNFSNVLLKLAER
ncbi:MAG: hypothetical protein KGJ89_02240 [Patescibacteria group bacterium]|nr:hypothetical protein [Patescibacteria group bacterium]MDE2015696.1 hypothetical protein [Patescibacteria group bacterium]MDE2226754.1 hypothetical protein [Patescibacteria group bacterium]